MEGHAQSVEDNLIESLSFKLRPGASYVTNRRGVTFWPMGGNQYSPTGVKVVKISLNADQWLDPATVKLFFDFQNTAAAGAENKLKPISPNPWIYFRRLRVLCGGQVVEDIDYYNRCHEMFHSLKPAERILNDGIEGFGLNTGSTDDYSKLTVTDSDTLAPQATRTLAFTPFAGILRQEKFIPLKFAPLQFEFDVVSSGAEVCDIDTGSNESSSFQLTNV